MRELVFLLEEASARAMLSSLLPRLLSEQVTFRLIPFEGKQDLAKQLARRIRGYLNPRARFIVLRDQDSHADCVRLKAELKELCEQSGRGNHCLVRIACRELEAMYLADLRAVERGLGVTNLERHQLNRLFRDPDHLGSPSEELKRLTKKRYEKVFGSRSIGNYLDLTNERSSSFKNLLSAIRRFEGELLALEEQ